MLNRVMLIGNLGASPEMRQTPSGVAVANFSVATTEKWTKDGEKKEATTWHKIVAWRRLAEICGEYLTKGSRVYLEGKMQTRSYEKDGDTKYITEVVIHQMQMLGGRPAQPEPQTGDNEYPVDDNDVPF